MSTDQTDSIDSKADAEIPEADRTVPEADPAVPEMEPVVPAEVIELIEKSETIQGWMERLADHADDARPEVLERVKTDYRTRLEGVAGQLGEHRPDLASDLEERQDTVVSLNSDRDSHLADLEEVGIRHTVGEFSEAEWDSHRSRIEAWLDDVDSKLEIEEGAVSELTAALDRIDASGPPRASVGSSVAFTSEGFVEVDGSRAGGNGNAARNPSWSRLVAEAWKDGPSDAASDPAGGPTNGGRAAEEDESVDSDELDFIDAVSTDDLERLDPISAAIRDSRV